MPNPVLSSRSGEEKKTVMRELGSASAASWYSFSILLGNNVMEENKAVS